VEAGENAVMRVHCSALGCNRWDSGYQLFALDSASGWDSFWYYPQSSRMSIGLEGAYYVFDPSGFSANTINVGTLNATTITGGVSGGSITSGTISAARLPLFGPSGTSHAPGIVPDPGATAGATRFLREDGTWDVPVGSGGGSPSGAAGGDLGGSYPNPTVTQAQSGAVTFNASNGTTTITGSNPYVEIANTASGTECSYFGTYPTLFQFSYNRRPSDGTICTSGESAAYINVVGGSGAAVFSVNLETGPGGSFATPLALTPTAATVGVPLSAPSYQETLTTPASSSAACMAGQFTDDANYHYVCVSTNTWKRGALSSF